MAQRRENKEIWKGNNSVIDNKTNDALNSIYYYCIILYLNKSQATQGLQYTKTIQNYASNNRSIIKLFTLFSHELERLYHKW